MDNSCNRRSSFGSSRYQGYRVSLKLVREGTEEYEPVLPPLNYRDVHQFMKDLEDYDREVFYSIHMDGRNKVLSCEEVAKGSASSCSIHPKEVHKAALLTTAQVVIFVHNHPSGHPTPSIHDKEITARLHECGELLGVKVLDSVIIGRGSYYSFADKGELKKNTRK